MIPKTILISEPAEIHDRLGSLGLELDFVQDLRAVWSAAEAAATPFEPTMAPGTRAWLTTIGVLREGMTIATGADWQSVNRRNWPAVVSEERGIAITITSGNELTGVDHERVQPRTKNPKGVVVADVVAGNRGQLELGAGIPEFERPRGVPRSVDTLPLTWFILMHCTPDELRTEVSLPEQMKRGQIVRWRERIVLPPMDRQSPPPIQRRGGDDADSGMDLDVPVVRK